MIWNWGFWVELEGDCLSNTLVFDYLELDTYYKLELQIQVVLLVLVLVIVVINYCCQFFIFLFCIITVIILVSTFETV